MMSRDNRDRLSLILNYDAELLYSIRPTTIIYRALIYFAPLHDATPLILIRNVVNECSTNRRSRGATQTVEGRKFECMRDSLKYLMKLSK